MDAEFVEFLSQSGPICFNAVVRIVNDYLSSSIEEFLDGIFTCVRNLLPERD